MPAAAIIEQDIPLRYIKPILQNDSTLMAMEVDVQGTARALQGVFYKVAPQDVENPFPCIVIQSPFRLQLPRRMIPLGPQLFGAAFGIDVAIQARDVEPDDADLLAMRGRIRFLLEGTRGNVTGGTAWACWVEDFMPDDRQDKGYIFTQIGLTFGVGAQVT